MAERPVTGRQEIAERPVTGRQEIAERPVTSRQEIAERPVTGRQEIIERPATGRQKIPLWHSRASSRLTDMKVRNKCVGDIQTAPGIKGGGGFEPERERFSFIKS